jgi:NADH-quinone oxidoreductase subunit L
LTPTPTSEASLIFYGLAVLGAPLLSFILCFLIPKQFSWLAPLISSLLLLLGSLFSALLFLSSGEPYFTIAIPWFTIGQKMNMIGFSIDSPMIIVTSVISFLVHVYSIGYMADDKFQKKYFGMLGLFTFSMLGLVMSTNLLVTFCFWELIGFSSYLLIGHYSEQNEAATAATKASLMNKVGDVSFIIFLMIVWTNLESLEVISLQYLSDGSKLPASIFLFVAVMAKSAQFPLFTWLPDAMEGPTPVSALLHSATMVAAGVFLLIQFGTVFFTQISS